MCAPRHLHVAAPTAPCIAQGLWLTRARGLQEFEKLTGIPKNKLAFREKVVRARTSWTHLLTQLLTVHCWRLHG